MIITTTLYNSPTTYCVPHDLVP